MAGWHLTIGVLECGAVATPLQTHAPSYTEAFRRFLSPDGSGPVLKSYHCYGGKFPRRGDECDGWLITGSAASVYDGDEWIGDLEEFARSAAESRPLVGICFGHQLIAQAFGGRVGRAPGWGIGVHRHELSEDGAPISHLELLASHQDQVIIPPSQARVLGGSEFCPIGSMTIGQNVLTIQNHPEMTREFAKNLYDSRRQRIGEETVEAALADLSRPTNEGDVREWILTFLGC